jgi:hypothetical protein
MLSPLPRHSDWWNCIAHPASRISLPRYGCQVGPCIVLFEVCSVFTHVTACTLALPPYFVARLAQRLQPFRCLHSCSGCFRQEQVAGWDFHPLENAAFSRRTPKRDIRAHDQSDVATATFPWQHTSTTFSSTVVHPMRLPVWNSMSDILGWPGYRTFMASIPR